ncbi:MAG: nusG [Verrucomicrobiales bacterium]|nr:nusG [Verrucomicrobiales bacterium]
MSEILLNPMHSPGIQDELAWFCVRSQPKHEHVAAGNLRKRLEIQVFNPRIRFKRPSSRGPTWVTESMFPSYLFARFKWKSDLESVKHTFGVAGVVHFGGFWPVLGEEVITELQTLVGDEEIRIVQPSIAVGQEVDISNGPFAGFHGIVTRVMPAKDRVAVLLDFLGRQTTVEVMMAGITKQGLGYQL